MRILQVTIDGGSNTHTTSSQIYSPFVVFQNNAANNMRLGDNTTTSTKGILLVGNGGSLTIQRSDNRVPLFNYYVAGTSGDKLDILYE